MSSKASFKQTTMNDTLQGEKKLYCGESKDSCAPFIHLFLMWNRIRDVVLG